MKVSLVSAVSPNHYYHDYITTEYKAPKPAASNEISTAFIHSNLLRDFDKMKLIYIFALLAPAILAAEQAMAAEDVAKVNALEEMAKKSCPDLSPKCLATAQKLFDHAKKNGAGSQGATAMKYVQDIFADKNCMVSLQACAKKIGPAFAAAHGPKHSM
ncbi:hypothetical protein PWT90_10346 [Aphanocladium album]|nr:hypothetical protein PWT90_10346 [Aphanocladium album]